MTDQIFIHGDSVVDARREPNPGANRWERRVARLLISADGGQATGPLYALVDAARSPKVFSGLIRHQESARIESLYQGESADQLRDVCPYLVSIEEGAALTDWLIRSGWGQSWCVFLSCDLPFSDVRRHFRKQTYVQVEGEENGFFFRFYDPRVLRPFLDAAPPESLRTFFGPVRHFLCEGERDDTIVIYETRDGRPVSRRISIPDRAAA